MRRIRVTAAIGLALLVLGVAAPPAGAAPPAHAAAEATIVAIDGLLCVGDTVMGVLHLSGRTGDTVELALYAKAQPLSSWAPTGVAQRFVLGADASGDTGQRFELDVGGLGSLYSYVVEASTDGTSKFSNVVRTTTCAPGDEIAEAPAALLLPASLLGTVAIGGFVRRRRHTGTPAR
jgi:hypothetical protein